MAFLYHHHTPWHVQLLPYEYLQFSLNHHRISNLTDVHIYLFFSNLICITLLFIHSNNCCFTSKAAVFSSDTLVCISGASIPAKRSLSL